MTQFIVLFGRTSDLAYRELVTFEPSSIRISSQAAIIQNPQFTETDYVRLLGGVVKVAKLLTKVHKITSVYELAALFSSPLKIFALSGYDISVLDYLKPLKDILQASYGHIRYIEPGSDGIVPSITIAKTHATELVLIQSASEIVIGQTCALQDVDAWVKRDNDRPFIDSKVGMLPLKVARMVLNISLNGSYKDKIVLDPFCGLGTIVSEAIFMGAQGIGSDISDKMIQASKKNITWLKDHYSQASEPIFFQSDATHIADLLDENSVDAIVTEPFMGSTQFGLHTISHQNIQNSIKGLEKLYKGCFKNWHRVLKPNGLICIALPSFIAEKKEYFVKNVVDTCESLGYTRSEGPYTYFRPQAIVKRNFYIFHKKG